VRVIYILASEGKRQEGRVAGKESLERSSRFPCATIRGCDIRTSLASPRGLGGGLRVPFVSSPVYVSGDASRFDVVCVACTCTFVTISVTVAFPAAAGSEWAFSFSHPSRER